jgi:thiol-disulfide isomerase/thioredoxin
MRLLRRTVRVPVAALLCSVVLTSCTDTPSGSGEAGFISGKGVITTLPVEEREAPGQVVGETIDGEPISLADYAGETVVVNVWGSWCGPCRRETPLLVDASDELPQGAVLAGVNIRDNADTARAFERSNDVPYPSIHDPGSEQLLAFPTPFNPRDIPSTMVLDREGRVAALIRGELPSKLTLLDVVEEVAAEDG